MAVNSCIFPVAGFGTRFLPVTKSVPKELLPILDKPLIHYAIDEAISSCIWNFTFITNKYKSTIESYFRPHEHLENLIKKNNKIKVLEELNKIIETCDFEFINQKQMLGLGHAISLAENTVDNNFAVILPDDLCFNDGPSVLEQMVSLSKLYPNKCIVAVEEVESSQVCNYGIVDVENILDSSEVYKVTNMVEKPSIKDSPSNLAVIGRYILTPEIFNILGQTAPDSKGEIQVTDALNQLAEKDKVIAYKFNGRRIDCGSMRGFVEANNFFYKKFLNK